MNNFVNQIQVSKLFQKDYLFEATPNSQGLYQYLTIIFGVMVVFAAILFFLNFRAYRKKEIVSKTRRKLTYPLLIIGTVGLLIIFFRYEAIAYFGSRLMFCFLLIAAICWLFSILWYQFIVLPKENKIKKQKEKFNKYLPTKKGKK